MPSRAIHRRLSGSVSLGWDGYRDEASDTADYNRLSARLSLRGEELLGRDLRVHLRLRHRSLERASAEDEQRTRLYVLALEFGAHSGPLHLALGRLGAGLQSHAGALDGLLLGRRFGGSELGIYFGAMPDWTQDGLSDRGGRGGVYLRFDGRPLRTWVEAVSERVDGEISRDYLILGGDWRRGALSLRQRLEVDWLRGWRRDRGSNTLGLSQLSLGADWRARPDLSLSLRLDRRETPLDINARSLPDSLFHASISGGSSLRLRWQPKNSTTLGLRLGWREHERAERGTTSGGIDLGYAPPFARAYRVDLRLSGFEGPTAQGLHPSLALRRRAGKGHELGFEAGLYHYSPEGRPARDNRWLRASGRLALPGRAWLDLGLEFDDGDDSAGRRVSAELGRRF